MYLLAVPYRLCPGQLQQVVHNAFQSGQLLCGNLQRFLQNSRIMLPPAVKQGNMAFDNRNGRPKLMRSIRHELLLRLKGLFELIH
ncbi:hypothetical protein D3C71_1983760 [compost metagenome]